MGVLGLSSSTLGFPSASVEIKQDTICQTKD